MEDELKPCPFCGGQATIKTTKTSFSYGCKSCRINTEWSSKVTESERMRLARMWNTRKPITNVINELHNAGGVDGSDDWACGYDSAINFAIETVEEITGISYEEVVDK